MTIAEGYQPVPAYSSKALEAGCDEPVLVLEAVDSVPAGVDLLAFYRARTVELHYQSLLAEAWRVLANNPFHVVFLLLASMVAVVLPFGFFVSTMLHYGFALMILNAIRPANLAVNGGVPKTRGWDFLGAFPLTVPMLGQVLVFIGLALFALFWLVVVFSWGMAQAETTPCPYARTAVGVLCLAAMAPCAYLAACLSFAPLVLLEFHSTGQAGVFASLALSFRVVHKHFTQVILLFGLLWGLASVGSFVFFLGPILAALVYIVAFKALFGLLSENNVPNCHVCLC